MTDIEFNNILDNDKRIIENTLLSYLPDAVAGQDVVIDAMKYSLLNGGKRIRPIMVLEFCKAAGCDRHKAIDLACAIEYIHTYSLIHDDLPCMDDDDLRRGKPSNHKQFGEAIALLAGDALLTTAFSIISESDTIDDTAKVKAIGLLSQNAGVSGMIGGQVIDLLYENANPSLRQLLTVHKLKTGALISAAAILGCIAADADDEKIVAASRFAYNLGIAFQIQDDILDVVGSEEKLGKPIGSDKENEKTTYVTKVGMDKAVSDVKVLTNRAINYLNAFEDAEFIRSLANKMISRDH